MNQNLTRTQTTQNFYPSPSGYPAAKDQSIDAETKHRIYDRLLNLLSNPQIKAKAAGASLPFILHSKTKGALHDEHGFSIGEIRSLENQIIKDAECFLDHEVNRDAPAALYHALRQTGETDLIFDNRIAALPNPVLNRRVCAELEKEFGRKTLLACDGFTEVRASDGKGVIHKAIRLDIDGWITRNGFMMPIYKGDLITALRVFRDPKDPKPFALRTRRAVFSLEVKK